MALCDTLTTYALGKGVTQQQAELFGKFIAFIIPCIHRVYHGRAIQGSALHDLVLDDVARMLYVVIPLEAAHSGVDVRSRWQYFVGDKKIVGNVLAALDYVLKVVRGVVHLVLEKDIFFGQNNENYATTMSVVFNDPICFISAFSTIGKSFGALYARNFGFDGFYTKMSNSNLSSFNLGCWVSAVQLWFVRKGGAAVAQVISSWLGCFFDNSEILKLESRAWSPVDKKPVDDDRINEDGVGGVGLVRGGEERIDWHAFANYMMLEFSDWPYVEILDYIFDPGRGDNGAVLGNNIYSSIFVNDGRSLENNALECNYKLDEDKFRGIIVNSAKKSPGYVVMKIKFWRSYIDLFKSALNEAVRLKRNLAFGDFYWSYKWLVKVYPTIKLDVYQVLLKEPQRKWLNKDYDLSFLPFYIVSVKNIEALKGDEEDFMSRRLFMKAVMEHIHTVDALSLCEESDDTVISDYKKIDKQKFSVNENGELVLPEQEDTQSMERNNYES